MTFANFNLFGKTPVFTIWFVIRVIGLMIDGAMLLSKMVDIPSIPTLLLFVKLCITIVILSCPISLNLNVLL